MEYKDKHKDEQIKNIDGSIPLLEQLTPLARQINCLDLNRIAEACIESIPGLVGVKFASLYILDDKTNILHLYKHNHPYMINKIVSLNQTPTSPMIMAVISKQLIMISNIDAHKMPVIKKSQRPFAEHYTTNNCAIVPLVCQDMVVGVLNLADKIDDKGFSSADIALIELFGQLIGASIGNIKLFEKIQHQARMDGLTGLVNHRTFYEILEKELWRSHRYGGKVALIMIDMDNLKQINDRYGHHAGDKAIREVAHRVKGCIRQIDTAARYGGDEFAVILLNTSLENASVVAQRMVESVSKLPAKWKNEQIELSVSIGLAEYDSDTKPEDIASRADKALYSAKLAGKNTMRVYAPANKQ